MTSPSSSPDDAGEARPRFSQAPGEASRPEPSPTPKHSEKRSDPAPAEPEPAPAEPQRREASNATSRSAREEPAPSRSEPVMRGNGALQRGDVYRDEMVAGRRIRDTPLRRVIEFFRELLTSGAEREESEVDAQLARMQGVSRPNVVAVVSPKGGVGKTTSSFLVGNLLAEALKARVVAVDANPDFGTLSALAPDRVRSKLTLADLLARSEPVETGPEMRPFMSALPSGLHVLAAPAEAEVMADIDAAGYDRAVTMLERFYDVVILDLGTGITGPVAQWAVRRADQLVVITTPEWITSANVSGALRHLPMENATLVLNQASADPSDQQAIEDHFRKQWLERRVTIPFDPQLRAMLDSGTYQLSGLSRATRTPVKRLGAAVGENLI